LVQKTELSTSPWVASGTVSSRNATYNESGTDEAVSTTSSVTHVANSTVNATSNFGTTTTPIGASTPASCVDQTRYCAYYARKKMCKHEKYRDFMKKACCRSCRKEGEGFRSTTTSTTTTQAPSTTATTTTPVATTESKKVTVPAGCVDDDKKAACNLIGLYHRLCKITYYMKVCCKTCTLKNIELAQGR